MANEEPSKEYDQAFFLALAAKGKDAWNAWRRDPANKDIRVNFEGIDFSEAPKDRIDFSGFEFGDHAVFSNCKWRGIKLEEVLRVASAFDTLAFQPGRAFFRGAEFGREANFNRTSFGDWVTFLDATFGQDACFNGTVFGDHALVGSAFGAFADFTGAAFGNGASFYGAAFGVGPKFNEVHFMGWAVFSGQSQDQWTMGASHRMGPEAFREMKQRHEASWKCWASLPHRLSLISFARALFDGADFSGRSFEHDTDFTGARFYSPPHFDNVTGANRIDFTGAHIGFVPPGRLLHWTSDTKVPLRLRALRKIAEETKIHDLERDLYIEERKAERGVYWHQLVEELKKAPEEFKKKLEDINKQKKHVWLEWRLQRRARNVYRLGIAVKIVQLGVRGFWIFVMGLYWALANYGRSFLLPSAWLALSVFFFHWGYAAILAPLIPQAATLGAAKYARAEWMVALGNAVPFVGPLTIDAEIKKFLFCPSGDVSCLPPIPPECFQLLVIAQNVLSIALVFFIGLALRNYFRIK